MRKDQVRAKLVYERKNVCRQGTAVSGDIGFFSSRDPVSSRTLLKISRRARDKIHVPFTRAAHSSRRAADYTLWMKWSRKSGSPYYAIESFS